MWCQKCGEGVPMIATPEDPRISICVSCKSTVFMDPGSESPAIPFTYPVAVSLPESESDDSQLTGLYDPIPINAIDEAHLMRAPHIHETAPKTIRIKKKRSSPLMWFTLLFGVTLFTGGATLIAMSVLEYQDELWRIGTPLAFAGQALLLIGVVLQLDLLSFQHRKTEKAIDSLTRQVANGAKKRARKPKPKKHHLPSLFVESAMR